MTDFEPLARERMSEMAWAYVSGGAGDEITQRENRESFDRLRLNARVLADLSGADMRVTILGTTFEHPILLAPVAYQKLAHPDGELATVAGANAARAGMLVGTLANVLIEDVARAATSPLWFQLYAEPDRGVTRELIRRAEAAGYRALVVTVDTPITGVRNREARLRFHLPPGVELVNLPGGKHRPLRPKGPEERLFDPAHLDAALTWKDIAWMQSVTSLPVVLKGVMMPADAVRAVDQGIAGVIVSNHGGRNIDTLPATIDVLPRIAEAVSGRVPLLLDGGVRRGTDVLKALALGAKAVLVGRPFVYGLAVAGSAGVAHVLNILRAELEAAMILTGRARLADIDRSAIWQS